MALRLEQKQVMVAEVNAVAQSALAAVTAEYRSLTVEQMNTLRVSARESKVYLRVVKNTLAKRAVEGTEFECLTESFEGPLVLAFSREEPGSAARVVKNFAKDNGKLVAKSLAFGGERLPATELDRLASLPTREEALSLLMSAMQAPITKFVRTLNEPHAKLVRTVAAVRDAKQAA